MRKKKVIHTCLDSKQEKSSTARLGYCCICGRHIGLSDQSMAFCASCQRKIAHVR